MIPQVFFTSDSHFGHANMVNFTLEDGSPMRPFSSVEEADECMVERWNSVVKPGDKVYHLGDVCMGRKALFTMDRLNGRKILIKGNHDTCSKGAYGEYFNDVRSIHRMHGLVLSHIPIHPASIWEAHVNVHGHLHHNQVRLPDGTLDLRYINVCVEHTNYTPISLDDLRQRINDRT